MSNTAIAAAASPSAFAFAFEVVGQPVDLGTGRYLATTRTTPSPEAGCELTTQLQV